MRIYDIIEKKKNGGVLTKSEIDFFVKNYTNGAIPDYQAAPLLMAICFNSMNAQECADLTMAMADSGAKLDLSSVGGVTADKHSTGGVGDKATLLVAPICAACGVKMAKMSGRGLGFTGGTADKLESIPGFTVSLDKDKFMKQVKNIGISVISQSADLAPADKKLYALRDVTATVDSLPLIASSIMSKKLAAGADVIVLDVKCGSGAFMKTKEDAEQLAKLMVDIGTKAGRKVCAIVSDMAQPLGTQVGNILEVREAVDALKKPRNAAPDLMEDCVTLSSLILMLSGKADSMDNAKTRVWQVLEKGDAYQKLKDMVKAQGGDVSYIDDTSKFDVVEVSLEKGDILLNDNGVHKNDAGEAVRVSYDFKAKKDGYITKMDTEAIGKAACILGAGREKIGDLIDFNSGITFLKKLGDSVNEGDTICVLHSTTNEKLRIADDVLNGAIKINPNPDVSLYNSAGKISHVYSYVLPAGIVQVSGDEKADSKSLRMLLNATPNAADEKAALANENSSADDNASKAGNGYTAGGLVSIGGSKGGSGNAASNSMVHPGNTAVNSKAVVAGNAAGNAAGNGNATGNEASSSKDNAAYKAGSTNDNKVSDNVKSDSNGVSDKKKKETKSSDSDISMGKNLMKNFTLRGFIALFLITLLGFTVSSGAFSIRSPHMYAVVDYLNNRAAMNYMITSDAGFNDADVEIVSKVNEVAAAEGVYAVNAKYAGSDGKPNNVQVISLTNNVNIAEVTGGSVSIGEGDCFVDQTFADAFGIKSGASINLTSADGNDITDYLCTNSFKVKGIVNSPYYVSYANASSDTKTGYCGYIMVSSASVVVDNYTFIAVNLYEDVDRESAKKNIAAALDTKTSEKVSERSEELIKLLTDSKEHVIELKSIVENDGLAYVEKWKTKSEMAENATVTFAEQYKTLSESLDTVKASLNSYYTDLVENKEDKIAANEELGKKVKEGLESKDGYIDKLEEISQSDNDIERILDILGLTDEELVRNQRRYLEDKSNLDNLDARVKALELRYNELAELRDRMLSEAKFNELNVESYMAKYEKNLAYYNKYLKKWTDKADNKIAEIDKTIEAADSYITAPVIKFYAAADGDFAANEQYFDACEFFYDVSLKYAKIFFIITIIAITIALSVKVRMDGATYSTNKEFFIILGKYVGCLVFAVALPTFIGMWAGPKVITEIIKYRFSDSFPALTAQCANIKSHYHHNSIILAAVALIFLICIAIVCIDSFIAKETKLKQREGSLSVIVAVALGVAALIVGVGMYYNELGAEVQAKALDQQKNAIASILTNDDDYTVSEFKVSELPVDKLESVLDVDLLDLMSEKSIIRVFGETYKY